jgi:predicted DNA-binding ribbon-helix-helix protein
MHDVNPKTSQKGCWKRNGCAITLKCFLEIDVHPSLQVVQRGGMHNVATIGKSFRTNLKWVWNKSELELPTLIASNKNKRKFTKNLKVMIRAIRAQLPRYVVNMIISKEMRPTLPKEMGRKTCQCIMKA